MVNYFSAVFFSVFSFFVFLQHCVMLLMLFSFSNTKAMLSKNEIFQLYYLKVFCFFLSFFLLFSYFPFIGAFIALISLRYYSFLSVQIPLYSINKFINLSSHVKVPCPSLQGHIKCGASLAIFPFCCCIWYSRMSTFYNLDISIVFV